MKRRLACVLVLAGCWTGSSAPPPTSGTTSTNANSSASGSGSAARDAGAAGRGMLDAGAAGGRMLDAGATGGGMLDASAASVGDAGGRVAVDAGAVVDAASASCPASFAAAESAGACNAFVQCTYPQGRCACSAPPWCGGAAPPPDYQRHLSWQCTPNVRPDGCPGVAPMTGQACRTPGKQCDYTCSCLNVATCAKGTWTMKRGPCKP